MRGGIWWAWLAPKLLGVVITILVLAFLGMGLGTTELLPENYPVLFDEDTETYITYQCIQSHKFSQSYIENPQDIKYKDRELYLLDSVREIPHARAVRLGRADPICRNAGGFIFRESNVTVEVIRWINRSLFKPAPKEVRTFSGFACSDDCSGHAAGYRWAFRNPDRLEECEENPSRAFLEGCRAFERDPTRGWQTDDAGREIGGS